MKRGELKRGKKMVSHFKLVKKNWEHNEPVFRSHVFKFVVRKYCIDPNAPRDDIARCEISFKNKDKKPRVVSCTVVVSKVPKDQEGDHTITVTPLCKINRAAVRGKIIVNHRMKSRFEMPFRIFKSKRFENRLSASVSYVKFKFEEKPLISVTFKDSFVSQDSHNDIFECYHADTRHRPDFILGKTTLFRKTLTWTPCAADNPAEKNYVELCPQCFTTSTSGFLETLEQLLFP
ncbi:MAG: hypothetical protein Q8P67_19550 [archaeon]|nr:hypothetical protein [archaeon]